MESENKRPIEEQEPTIKVKLGEPFDLTALCPQIERGVDKGGPLRHWLLSNKTVAGLGTAKLEIEELGKGNIELHFYKSEDITDKTLPFDFIISINNLGPQTRAEVKVKYKIGGKTFFPTPTYPSFESDVHAGKGSVCFAQRFNPKLDLQSKGFLNRLLKSKRSDPNPIGCLKNTKFTITKGG